VRKRSFDRSADPAFADWVNDDLLVTDKAQAALNEQHPSIFPLLDWPELRAIFIRYEQPANREKERLRRAGLRAVLFAFCAFGSSAICIFWDGHPLSGAPAWGVAGFALTSSLCAAMSFGTGLLQTLQGNDKERWLLARLWTETLRRFHFQFVLRHMPLAVDILAGRTALGRWREAQASALAELENDAMQRPPDVLQAIIADTAAERVWVLASWRNNPDPAVADCRETSEILAVLQSNRIRAQIDYAARRLHGTRLALRGKTTLIRASFYMLVFCILGLSIALGVARALDQVGAGAGAAVSTLGVLDGMAAAALISIQMWERGEDISGEMDRLEWYYAGVDSVRRRFEVASEPMLRLQALGELEALAYQEMRQFLVSATRREFIAG
jgi:hypothetical protein